MSTNLRNKHGMATLTISMNKRVISVARENEKKYK